MKTITLFDRRPVEIDEDQWPVVASVHDWEGQHKSQIRWEHKIFVRQSTSDGRCLVYGVKATDIAGQMDARGGFVADNIDSVPDVVKQLATRLGFSESLADRCIAKLPAEQI